MDVPYDTGSISIGEQARMRKLGGKHCWRPWPLICSFGRPCIVAVSIEAMDEADVETGTGWVVPFFYVNIVVQHGGGEAGGCGRRACRRRKTLCRALQLLLSTHNEPRYVDGGTAGRETYL